MIYYLEHAALAMIPTTDQDLKNEKVVSAPCLEFLNNASWCFAIRKAMLKQMSVMRPFYTYSKEE